MWERIFREPSWGNVAPRPLWPVTPPLLLAVATREPHLDRPATAINQTAGSTTRSADMRRSRSASDIKVCADVVLAGCAQNAEKCCRVPGPCALDKSRLQHHHSN